MDLGLGGRVALVSGAHRGTGAGIARILAAEGAAVAVHGFAPGQSAAVVDVIVAAGGRAVGVDDDLSSDEGAARVVADVEDRLGPIEVLVNNYGAPIDSTWESPADRWHDAWDRNVLTGVRLTHRVLPHMRERGWGRVIFLGTIGTARPGDRNPDYYGAKAALPAVARSLAKHLRGSGITVNVVSPGLIATDEVKAMILRRFAEATSPSGEVSWEDAAAWGALHVMPNLTERIATPDDIGRMVAFVASEAAWHLQGADIRIDGGALDA